MNEVSYQLLLEMAAREEKLKKVREVEQKWYALDSYDQPQALDILADWIKAEVEYIGAKGVVLGVSGGVDSALAAVLLARAMPEKALAVYVQNPEEKDALRLIKLLGLPFKMIKLDNIIAAFLAEVSPGIEPSRLVKGNLISRLQNALLYYFANLNNFIVLGTGDLDEVYIGYSTKGTASDLFPLNGLHKSEVRALLKLALEQYDPEFAAYLAEKPASPGYWQGQKAEAELGMSYFTIEKAVDLLLKHCDIWGTGVLPKEALGLEKALPQSGISNADFLKVCNLIGKNYHKSFGSPALHHKS